MLHEFQIPLAIKTAAVVETAIYHTCNDGEIDLEFGGSTRRAPWKPFEIYRISDEKHPCLSPTANALYSILCRGAPVNPNRPAEANAISHLRYLAGDAPVSDLEVELWALYDYIVLDGYYSSDVDMDVVSGREDLRAFRLALSMLNTVSDQSESILQLSVDQTSQEYAHAMTIVEKSAIAGLASFVDDDPTLFHSGWIFGFAYALIEGSGIGPATFYRRAAQKSPLERICRRVLQYVQ